MKTITVQVGGKEIKINHFRYNEWLKVVDAWRLKFKHPLTREQAKDVLRDEHEFENGEFRSPKISDIKSWEEYSDFIEVRNPMKTITIPVGGRENYFREFLESLSKNDLTGYVIYFGFEPDGVIIDLCKQMPVKVVMILNDTKLGIRKNPFSIIERAFADGSEFNVHLEDDIKLSPDAICLANWYYEKFKNSNEYSAYGFYNMTSSHRSYSKLIVVDKFFGYGWCCFKRDWVDIFKKYWFDDDIARKHFGCTNIGWDWSISGAFKEFGKKQIVPRLSRSTHIGREGGIHFTPEFHDQMFSNVIWNQDKIIKDFRL